MNLILRRALASSINGIVISILLLIIYFFIAASIFFLPVKNSYLGMYIFSILFAAIYSFCGSMNIGWLPTLGKKIAKIKLEETNTTREKSVKIMLRIFLWYLIPSLLLFISRLPERFFNKNDPYEVMYVDIFLILLALLVLLPMPITIVVSNGKQGLHDFLSGIIVLSTKSKNSKENLPFKMVLVRTSIIVPITAVILTFGVVKLNIASNYHKNMINYESDNKKIREILDVCESFFSITPKELSKYDIIKVSKSVSRFVWWVDLTKDSKEQFRINKEIGMNKFNKFDLLGYGLSFEKNISPIKLISIKRDVEQEIPTDSQILSVYMFYNAGTYFYPEIKSMADLFFLKNILSNPKSRSADVIRVKAIRIVKVGVLKIGCDDEVYITTRDGKYWRDLERVTEPTPSFVLFDNKYATSNALITSYDLDPPSSNSFICKLYITVHGKNFYLSD